MSIELALHEQKRDTRKSVKGFQLSIVFLSVDKHSIKFQSDKKREAQSKKDKKNTDFV